MKHGQSTGLGSHFGKQSGSAAGAAPPCTWGKSVNALVALMPISPGNADYTGVGVDR